MKVYIKVPISVSKDGKFCNRCTFIGGYAGNCAVHGEPLELVYVKSKPKVVRCEACKQAEVKRTL